MVRKSALRSFVIPKDHWSFGRQRVAGVERFEGFQTVIDTFVPLYHPHELFVTAVLDGDVASGHLLPTLGWVLGVLVIAFVAYGRAAGNGWLTSNGCSA